MFTARRPRLRASPSSGAFAGFAAAALVPLLIVAVALVSVTTQPWRDSSGRAQAYPAGLIAHVLAPVNPGGPPVGEYAQAADVVELGGLLYVLDTGNDRIVAQDSAGAVVRVIGGSAGQALALHAPMSIATDGSYLYVADTAASRVLILEPGGLLVKAIDLGADAPAGLPPRPVGLAVHTDGSLLVSDPDNNRLLHYDSAGRLQSSIGAGARASGSDGFNAPGGLTSDGEGYTYVADILNGRVVKVAADGAFLQQFGRLGDTAGTFSRPKDVAVDAAGNLYASDGLLAAVQVFGASGEYLGFIGRADPGDRHSGPLFVAPAGLLVAGDRLYVIDRFAGLFVFDLTR